MQYFLNDFWNFEHFVKIWTGRPPNYYQNASTNTRTIMESSLKISFLDIWASRNLKMFNVFESMLNIYIWKIILRRWGLKNATFSNTKQHTGLDMKFISIKKHEQEITLNFFIFKDGTLNFLILKKGTHPTLISR